MHNEADPLSLEDRLRHEAQQIASHHAQQASAAAILAVHRRRAKNRRLRIMGIAATGLIGVATMMAAMTRIGSDGPSAPRLAESPTTENSVSPLKIQRSQVVEKIASADEAKAEQRVAFLLKAPGADGRPVIAVGVYLPPRMERVNLDDLPPAQQVAVRQVLDLDEEEVKPTI